MVSIFVCCGKINYTNLSRYSNYSEKTYRRHFEQGLALEGINQGLIVQTTGAEDTLIVAVDATFLAKSGRHTYGLDWFYNGKNQRSERGLEWSAISVVDVEQNTAYTLSGQQTEPGLAQQQGQKSRVDFYLGHLAYTQQYLPPGVRYVVTDGFYTKYKWVTGVVQLGLQSIGKLRCDANLKFLYQGKHASSGTPSSV